MVKNKIKKADVFTTISLSLKDFKKKYAGSTFGFVWAFVQPVITILVYWVVFQFAFKSQDVNGSPFILWFMGGIVPWLFFADAFAAASNCFLEYNYLVKKMVFNIEILPIVKILSSVYVHLFFLSIYFGISVLLGQVPTLRIIQIVYYMICLIFFISGISYLFATASVFFRDVSQLISIILLVGMWSTPITWNMNIFPESLQKILSLNPLVYVLDGYRDSFLKVGSWFWEKPLETLYFWCITVIVFAFGKRIFDKTKKHFSDVL